MIASALAEYDGDVRAAWTRIRIEPEKWQCSPWGDESGGFWVVALDDGRALWFNDIEEGFNWSTYAKRGILDEYLCNQTEFSEVLDYIAQGKSEAVRARIPESELPAEIPGPGVIEFRQTTYWQVRATSVARYRIQFRHKVEFAFATSAYSSIVLADRHPLLVQYDQPRRSLYFVGTPLRPRSVAENLERIIRDVSESWRGLHDYAGSIEAAEGLLRGGHGLLMHAPGPVSLVVASALEAEGVQCSILDYAPARPGMRVLVLGRSYVVAEGFAFEKRDTT